MANGPFSGGRVRISPSLSADNWTLNAAAAGVVARILEVHMGGHVGTSTPVSSRVVRPTTGGSTPTNGTVGKINPNAGTEGAKFVTTWGTQPTLPSAGVGELWTESWNAHGGVVRALFAPGEEIVVVNGVLTGQVSCRNEDGIPTSTYGLVWDEL